MYRAFISYSHSADGKLAPALQSALQQFAKPWYRLRAIRVFRDSSTLAVTDRLWTSIAQALESSDFFIVLASPAAAQSKWVSREVRFWLKQRTVERLFLVLTDGELVWNEAQARFDSARSTALPPELVGVFAEEPRWIDLRFARGSDELSLNHPQFSDAVADIAARLHDRPKDEIAGEEVRQHRRRIRIARSAAAALLVLAVSATALGLVARYQRETAREQRDRAEHQTRVALSRQLAAEADAARDDQFDLALLLAVQANATMSTPEARTSLLQTLLRSPHLLSILPGTGGATQAAFGPRGQVLAVGGRDGSVALWTTEDRREIRRFHPGRGVAATSLVFSGDGRRLASGDANGHVRVWAVASGQLLADRLTGNSRVTSVALDRSGRTFAAAAANGRVTVGTTERGGHLETFRIRGLFHPPLQVAIVGDDTIVAGDTAGRLTRWSLRSNELTETVPGVGGLIGPPSVSAYGPELRQFGGVWLGRPDVRTPTLFDATSARRDRVLDGPATAVDAMAFSRDGQMLATAGEGRVILWSIPLGRARDVTLIGVPGAASAVRFSPDGRLIATAAQRGVAIWDLRKSALLHRLKAKGATVGHVAPALQGTASAAFSPNGAHLAWSLSGPEWAGVVVWRLSDSKEITRFPATRVAAFSADGKRLAAVDDLESGFIVVDLKTGKRRHSPKIPWPASTDPTAPPASNDPWTVAGQNGVAASAALDGAVTLWDMRRRQAIATLRVPGVVETPFLVFDRAGDKLAIATAGGGLAIIDLAVESWRVSACRLAARSLTTSEWKLFVGTQGGGTAACSG